MHDWEAWARAYDGPEHRSIWFAGDRPAAVLLHGFPGTPAALRPLAEALHRAGWTVRAPLLPGFGADLASWPERRHAEWVAAARAEWRLLGEHHAPTLLLGHGAGAAVALAVAAHERVSALALVAPVQPTLSPPARWAWPLLRRLFAHGKAHARWPIDWDAPDVRHALARLAPERDLDDPADRRAMQAIKVPGPLLDELLRLGAASCAAAPRHTGPALVVHPRHESPVERAQALGLVRALGGPVHYLELDGGHDVITPDRPGHDALLTSLTRFAWDAWEPRSGRHLSRLDWN